MRYTITGHPLLTANSESVAATDPAVFEEIVDVAEAMLGITLSFPSPDNVNTGRLATVYQVNHLVAMIPDVHMVDQKWLADRKWQYKDDTPTISPAARDLLAPLRPVAEESSYETLSTLE